MAPRDTASKLTPTTSRALDRLADGLDVGVVVLCGFPASGKSTAAAYLASTRDGLVMDKEGFAPALEKSVMAELTGDPHDRDSAEYQRLVGPFVYQALIVNALKVGRRQLVFLDAPFLEHISIAAAEHVPLADYFRRCANVAAPVKTGWIAADPAEIRARMTLRAAARDKAKLADWASYRSGVLESGIEQDAKAVVEHYIVN